MITKILEIKGTDWMKGLSIQSGLALGGLFESATNFDPFDTMGYLRSSLLPVTLDPTTITTQVNHITPVGSSVDGYVFALGDRAGTGTKCFYKIKLSDNTVEDYSANIDSGSTGAISHMGMTYNKSKIVYCGDIGSIRSVTTTGTTDVEILSAAGTGGTDFPVSFELGADGELYYTNNSSSSIGKILSVTSNVGNVANAFTIADTSFRPKDITNDGIYTIIIADNNISNSTISTSSCKIFFWDNLSSRASIIYDIPDSKLIAGKYVNGKVLILGASGLWACNSATPPKLIFPLTSSKLPTGANMVRVKDNILYWGIGTKIYAYGSKIGNSILYTPYTATNDNNTVSALGVSGPYLLTGMEAGTDPTAINLLNSGTTRTITVARTATTSFTQPFTFSYAKVVLKSPLATGQEITLGVYNGNDQVIMDATTKNFTTNGAKQTLIFEPNNPVGGVKSFEDLYVNITINTEDAIVQRVTIYGKPIDDYSQSI